MEHCISKNIAKNVINDDSITAIIGMTILNSFRLLLNFEIEDTLFTSLIGVS